MEELTKAGNPDSLSQLQSKLEREFETAKEILQRQAEGLE